MPIHERDLLFYVGGAAWQKFGTFTRRCQVPRFGGENVTETVVRATPAWYRDRTGIYRKAAVGVLRPHWVDGQTTPTVVVEPARTNILSQSTPGNDDTHWLNSAGHTLTAKSPLVAGTTPYEHASGATGYRYQTQGTFTTANDCLWALLENTDATTSRIGVWDNTTGAWETLIELTWATGVVADVAGSSSIKAAIKLADSGPNGGAVYWVGCRTNGVTNGNLREVYVYPDPSVGALAAIIHHVQFEAGAAYPSMTPIVTPDASDVPRDADRVTTPFSGPVESFQVYSKLEEMGGLKGFDGASLPRLWTLAGPADPQAFVNTGDGLRWQAYLSDAGNVVAVVTTGTEATFGDTVELLYTAEIADDEATVTMERRVNGGAGTVVTSTSTSYVRPDGWSSYQFAVGSGANADNYSGHGHTAHVGVRMRDRPASIEDFREWLPS